MKGRNLRIKLADSDCMPYKHLGGAAWDLKSNEDTFELKPFETKKVHTGVYLEQDNDMCAIILPRSGQGSKYGLHLKNTIGLIDPDYRGELIVNLSTRTKITIERYDRIAQLLFLPYINVVNMQVTETLAATERGEGGFGSSGV